VTTTSKRSQSIGSIAVLVLLIAAILTAVLYSLTYQTYMRDEFSLRKFKNLEVADGADVDVIAAEIGYPLHINGFCYVALIEPATTLMSTHTAGKPTAHFSMASGAPLLSRDYEVVRANPPIHIPAGTSLAEFLERVREWSKLDPMAYGEGYLFRGEKWLFSSPSVEGYDDWDGIYLNFDDQMRLVQKKRGYSDAWLWGTPIPLRRHSEEVYYELGQ